MTEPKVQWHSVPRRWYALPAGLGLILMLGAVLVVVFPRLLALFFAIPVFAVGLGIFLFGLDVWHGVPDWRDRARSWSRRCWPGE